VTNDDGIDAPGIRALFDEMKKIGDAIVVAPDRQQSAVGHALTMQSPLRATEFKRNGEMLGYSINGTPSDCVKLAISNLLHRRPDILVSGINHGQNTSINVLYSGTVSAATEGMLVGIPSLAVSLDSYTQDSDCTVAAEYAGKLAKYLLNNKLPERTLINVNVPAVEKEEIKGIKVTRQSKSVWRDSYEKRTDPFGRDYFWFAGEYRAQDQEPDTDDFALARNYVSVMPIRFEFTNNDFIGKLKNIEE
jgi:5'-nucleotidase